MANDTSARQWRLDTPVAFGQPNALLWNGNVYIKQIIWSGYAAQGNSLIIKDRNGRTVWQASGKADLSDDAIRDIGWVEGLVLDTLTAGLCTVHIK